MDPALEELLTEGAADDEVAVIVRLDDPAVVPPRVSVVSRFDHVVTCRLPRAAIAETRAHPSVRSMKAARDVISESAVAEGVATAVSQTDERRPPDLREVGRGVVVGLCDFGCDFAAPDFRYEDGTTRLLALWDQRGGVGPAAPVPFGYGVLHTAEAINRALSTDDPYGALGYHHAESDRAGVGTHGTHCLSIAAGNGRSGGPMGVAPGADLVFVHLASPDVAGTANLGDSVSVLEGVDFVRSRARGRPWVVNLSIGNQGGPKDGSTLVERGLDAALKAPGAAIVLSTGNYYRRPIHAEGRLQTGGARTIGWDISPADLTPNELECWYGGDDAFTAQVRAPDGTNSRPVRLMEKDELRIGGRVACRIYHRRHDPNNGKNLIDIFTYPGAPAGRWSVTISADDITDGRYHCWVERDGACTNCQSLLRPADAVPSTTLGTLCTGLHTIAVGAYDPHTDGMELGPFSSAGPTADGRVKPDIVAPGVLSLAARSAPMDGEPGAPLLTRKSGSSMAAPCVAGTIALMFEAARRPLSIHETRRLLLASAIHVTGPSDLVNRVGDGYLDIPAAVRAAQQVPLSAPTQEAFMEDRSDIPTIAPLPEPTAPAAVLDSERETFEDELAKRQSFAAIDEEESPVEKQCRERWLAWLASLPAPVQEASRQVKSLDDQDALMLRAIQHGVRDPNLLARLAFYSLAQFGYCPPKGIGLESWHSYRGRANDLLRLPVPPPPDLGPRPSSGRGQNLAATRMPDAPGLDVTGRYYFWTDQKPYVADWRDHKPFGTLLINQAGRRIAMRLTRVLDAADRNTYSNRPATDYDGYLQANEVFRVFNRAKVDEQGLVFRKDGRLFLRMERPSQSADMELVRLERARPTLLAPSLNLLGSGRLGKLLERHELFPLTPEQIQRVRKILDKSKLDEIIGRFFATSDQSLKEQLFSVLIKRVATLNREFHPSDLPLVRLFAREELSFNTWTSARNVRRSHLDWIQMMTDWVRSELQPGSYDYGNYYKTLSTFLGIRLLGARYVEKPPNTYEVTVNLFGGALVLGEYWGDITFMKTSEPRWSKPESFPIDLTGVVAGVGPDVALGRKFKGIAQSYLPWTSNDIRGPVRMFRASGDAGMGLVSGQMGFMHVLGDGSLNPLDVFFWSADLGVPDPTKVAEEGIKERIQGGSTPTPKGLVKPDLTVSALVGNIGGPYWMMRKLPLIDASTPLAVQRAGVEVASRQRVHFDFDGAFLSDAGRESLRQLCADYLPVFQSPQAQLVVVGHADSVGKTRYNLDLSSNRANNTILAISDILGKGLRAKHLAIPMSELAARLGGKDEHPDPRFRRVDIFLNGHLVLTLGGPPSP